MRNPRSARDRAASHIQAIRDSWWPTPVLPGDELDAIPSDLLRELADERLMVSMYKAYGMKDVDQDKEPDEIRTAGTFDRLREMGP